MKRKLFVEYDIRGLIDPSNWVVAYGSLMTILMIFFVILYGYAYISSAGYEKTIDSLQKSVLGVKDKNLAQTVANKEKETELAGKFEEYLYEKGLEKFGKAEITAQKVKILLTSSVLFNTGTAELKSEALATLNKITGSARGMNNPIIVEGHTDNLPIHTGRYRSNWELSAACAFSVISYFISQGISPARLSALGYGEYRPVAPNDTEENREKNRRIEILSCAQNKYLLSRVIKITLFLLDKG